ncbi:isoamyl acetate-hydrolyzing esterase 1 homolog [Glandiceps talaboti]
MYSIQSGAILNFGRVFLFSACLYCRVFSTTATKTNRMWPKVILFGDSITQHSFNQDGWGSSVADQLQRKCDVINRGVSGYNTRWGHIILPQIITKDTASDVAMVTVFFGANDASMLKENPQQHVPIDEYKQNLQKMVDYIVSVGIDKEKIVMIGCPPVFEKAWEEQCREKGTVLNRNNEVTGNYSKQCCEVAKTNNIECIDLWTSMQKDEKWERFLNDGLHLSSAGSKFLADRLLPIVAKKTKYIPLQYPYWADVNAENPEESLLNYNPHCSNP